MINQPFVGIDLNNLVFMCGGYKIGAETWLVTSASMLNALNVIRQSTRSPDLS